MPLPCFGDTIDELSIWRRRPLTTAPLPPPPPPCGHPLIRCGSCGAQAWLEELAGRASASGVAKRKRPAGPGAPAPPALLRRCRYCRLATYCSPRCAAADAQGHERYHALKQVRIERPLAFDLDFYELRRPFL